jgi:hypothetical protein
LQLNSLQFAIAFLGIAKLQIANWMIAGLLIAN